MARLDYPFARPDRRNFIEVTPESLNELEDYMNKMDNSIQAVRYGIGRMNMILAAVDHGESLRRSRGGNDPYQKQPQLAWKIPVRRITGRYYWGWQIKRLSPGVWMVYNRSREAYYIEFGIHTSTNRVRRPIRKLSLIATLRWAEKSRIYHRIQDDVFQPRRGGRLGMTGTTAGISLAGVAVQSPAQNMGGVYGGSF